MIEFRDPVAEHIKAFILDETAMEIDNRDYPSDPIWREYRESGSRIWLYGNDEEAEKVWTRDMEAVYLDTPLLNNALRQDCFTELIVESNSVLKGLPRDERIKEIAFIINARNAVASSKRFAARVCVEIPLFSASPKEIGQYTRRLYQVCPENLLPALPYSTAGLKAAQELQQAGIPVIIRTECNLQQVKDSIRRFSPGFVAIDRLETSRESLLPPVQELKDFLDQSENLGSTSLIAFGLNSKAMIQQLIGFPVVVVTPSAAVAYQENHKVDKADSDSADRQKGTPEQERSIAQQSRNSYHELVLLIRNAIDSN